MSKHAAPRHRKAPERPVVDVPRQALRATLTLTGIAVGATTVVVGGGVVLNNPPSTAQADVAASGAFTPSSARIQVESQAERAPVVSRSSSRRQAADPAKAAALGSALAQGRAVVQTEDLADQDPRSVASALLKDFGWGSDQFGCLDSLWTKESGWNVHADNPSSSAYGIPQALPGSKMGSAGPDWQNNPVTQVKWGLGYIQGRYGSPCAAWGHSQSHNWY